MPCWVVYQDTTESSTLETKRPATSGRLTVDWPGRDGWSGTGMIPPRTRHFYPYWTEAAVDWNDRLAPRLCEAKRGMEIVRASASGTAVPAP